MAGCGPATILLGPARGRNPELILDGNPYELLGVEADADPREVRRAYHRLAQERHPDKLGALSEQEQREAEAHMQAINQAYEQLTDAATQDVHADRRRRKRGKKALVVVVWGSVAVLLAAILTTQWPRWVSAPEREAATRGRSGADSPRTLAALIRDTKDRPGDSHAWELRWRAEAAAGLPNDAAKSLLRAVQLDSGNVALHEARARLAVNQGDATAAAEELAWLRANGFAARADAATRH